MAKFRKKPVVIEAQQWFLITDNPGGDIPQVVVLEYEVNTICHYCSLPMSAHGWIQTLEGGHIVCKRDWIIKGIKGEFYPCKPDIFVATYDLVEEAGDGKAE